MAVAWTPFLHSLQRRHRFPNTQTTELRKLRREKHLDRLKRHDLGPNFHEINFDGTIRTHFLTTPLWGVGTSANYGHDVRSHDLMTVILRHGGEAKQARDNFANTNSSTRRNIITFLNTLILFPPDDTSSNLEAANPDTPGYPQFGHGRIRLGALFNNPNDPE